MKDTVEIHDSGWKVDYVHDVVRRVRECSWHWHESVWKPRDIVIARKGGAISFDLFLAADAQNLEPVKEGWKKDHCAIFGLELIESLTDPAHGTGFTNGREWLCIACFEAGRAFSRPPALKLHGTQSLVSAPPLY